MKIYVKANTQKPLINTVTTEWEDIDNGIKFIVYSEDGEVLFEELFDYSDVDSDAIYDSAVDMAIVALKQKYELSDEAVAQIKDNEETT